MHARIPLAISILALVCAGCGGAVRDTVAPVDSPAAPHLLSATATVQDGMLMVAIRTDHPLLDLRGRDLQVFVDADGDPGTGYGAHGDEFVGRSVESADATRFPIRRTEPADAGDPAGWGSITGTGWIGTRDLGPVFRIPLAALGGAEGDLKVRIEMYSGGSFDYLDAETGASVAAAH